MLANFLNHLYQLPLSDIPRNEGGGGGGVMDYLFLFQDCNFQKERIACFLSGLWKFRVTVRLKACLRNVFS